MPSWFYNLGRLAGPKVRKGQWFWQSLTGSEEDVIAAEEKVGRDLHEAIAAHHGVEPDAALRKEIARLGESLTSCVRNKVRKFHFTVLPGGEPNAFAIPGGYVYITRSLVELVGASRDETAFVLGHEMAHVIKQHAAERVFNDAAFSAVARAIPVAGAAGQWVQGSAMKLLQSAYSQDNELLADKLGAKLAAAAGFDAMAGVKMLTRMREFFGNQPRLPLAEYFATHPPFEVRIAELSRYMTP